MNIDRAARNLHELMVTSTQGGKLIASPTGKIFCSKYGWGIFLNGVYPIMRFLGMENLEQECLKYGLKKTQKAYKEQLEYTMQYAESYQQELKDSYSGKLSSKREQFRIRKKMINWYAAAVPFRKAHDKVWYSWVRNHLTQEFSSNASELYHEPLSEGKSEQMLRNLKPILFLEAALKRPLPLSLFKLVSRDITLKKNEKHQLERFVHRINKHAGPVGIRTLHKALNNVHKLEPVIENRPMGSLTTLEMAFVNQDCPIFVSDDQKLLKFKRQLKTGDKIVYKNRIYTLGEKLEINQLRKIATLHLPLMTI